MKIAIVSDDGKSVSSHFGRAPLFVVVTVSDNKVTKWEERAKTGHHTFADHHTPKLAPGERHGYDTGSQTRHASMMETIADCQILIAGGMGWGAYENLESLNITPLLTDIESVDEAVHLCLEGKLTNQEKLLH